MTMPTHTHTSLPRVNNRRESTAFFWSVAASNLAIVILVTWYFYGVSRDKFSSRSSYSVVKMPKAFLADLRWKIMLLRLYKGLKCKTIAELLVSIPQL